MICPFETNDQPAVEGSRRGRDILEIVDVDKRGIKSALSGNWHQLIPLNSRIVRLCLFPPACLIKPLFRDLE